MTHDEELRLTLVAVELYTAGRLMGNSRAQAVHLVLKKARAWLRKGFALTEFPTIKRLALHRATI